MTTVTCVVSHPYAKASFFYIHFSIYIYLLLTWTDGWNPKANLLKYNEYDKECNMHTKMHLTLSILFRSNKDGFFCINFYGRLVILIPLVVNLLSIFIFFFFRIHSTFFNWIFYFNFFLYFELELRISFNVRGTS